MVGCRTSDVVVDRRREQVGLAAGPVEAALQDVGQHLVVDLSLEAHPAIGRSTGFIGGVDDGTQFVIAHR